MKDYLKLLGLDAQKLEINTKKIPMYLMNEYVFEKYVIEGVDCLLIKPDKFNHIRFNKDCKIINEIYHCHVVMVLDTITPYQRKILIEGKIPFIVMQSQLYLPFLAVFLTEKYEIKKEIIKFSPLTQLVFLFIFYNDVKLTAVELANLINCTNMTVTRAYKILVDSGLFKYDICGRKKYIIPNYNKKDIIIEASKYLINPISKVIYVKNNDNYLLSGLHALQDSDINVSDNDISYAIYKDDISLLTDIIGTEEHSVLGNGIKIECWNYDPKILTNTNVVDEISLILTMKDENDERILSEIERIRRKFGWSEG